MKLRPESLTAVEGGLVGGAEVERLCYTALVHFQQGRFEKARQLWERALVADPRHVKTLSSLGLLHGEQGQVEQARPLWERALEVDPDDQEIQSLLASLADVRRR